MQNVFDKLLNNLVIAALVPALVFFTILATFFENIIPAGFRLELQLIFETRATLIIVAAICLSFVLSYCSEIIYLIYRGEKFPKNLNLLEINRAKKRKKEIETQTKIKAEYYANGKLDDPKFKQAILEEKRLIDLYNDSFPPDDDDILPTRLGNVLKAMETYPFTQYKIDVRVIWNRLKLVIPSESLAKIDQANNEMAFLINSSLLSFTLAIISFLIAGFQFLLLGFRILKLLVSILFPISGFDISAPLGLGILYLLCSYAFAFLAYGFYRLSIPIALRYETLYRSVFDLYRFKIIEELRFECPKSMNDEQAIWQYVVVYLTPDQNFIKRNPDEFESKDFVHPGMDKTTTA